MEHVVIWDGDGVVFDSMPSYTRTFSGVLYDKYGISKEESSRYFLRSAGIELSQQFEQVLYFNSKDINDKNFLIDEFWNRQKNEMPGIFPDAIPAMGYLSADSRITYMTMASGTKQDVLEDRLHKLGLEKYIKSPIGNSVSDNKWSYVARLAEASRAQKYKIAFVGDAENDMIMTSKLGVPGIIIARDKGVDAQQMLDAGASKVIGDLRELKDVLFSIWTN